MEAKIAHFGPILAPERAMGAIQIAIGLMEKAIALPGEKAKVIEKDPNSNLEEALRSLGC